jgi:predicted CXXCH cytochrome family protein
MERHCSQCHELTFDPSFPERQLPHGKPEEVIFTLEGHYLKRLSDPDYKPQKLKKRRRPDRRKKRPEVCSDATYACALENAARDTEDQFTRQGCVSCHEVTVHPERGLYQRYQVEPVRLTFDYFPTAAFDHADHRSMKYPDEEKALSGNDACAYCHGAETAKESSELLLPDVDLCVRCHLSEREPGVVPMQCISCHAYHPQQSGNDEEMRSPP